MNNAGVGKKARAAYFAIISSIEEGEATWTSSFGHCDIMYPPVGVMGNDPDSTKVPKVPVSHRVVCKDYYCREYQKGECVLSDPHKAWIKNGYEQVEHFCSACFRAKLGKQPHMPMSDNCAMKK